MRIDKFLADCGKGTRSALRAAVKKGAVTVNGAVIKDPGFSVTERNEVTLSGEAVLYQKHIYLMMNKPKGTVCATEDKTYKTVISLLSEEHRLRGLFPVGRLDIDTEGLLLLTDDGDFSHRVTSPKSGVSKTYYLKTELPIKPSYAESFLEGVYIPGGYKTMPAQFEQISEYEGHLTVCEGKFHQVKFMLEAVGNRVIYLRRLSIGRLTLDKSLSPGEYRALLPSESVF